LITVVKDLHSKPFDESTKVKLALYENYLKEWLPVFLSKSSQYRNINIFDFFAGPGMDINGSMGSPLITIELLYHYLNNIVKNGQNVTLYFNDKIKDKIEILKQNILELNTESKPYNIVYSTEDFEDVFKEYIPLMDKRGTSNFLFLDQNGIKHITDEVFKTFVSLPRTDFLFFISSSTLHRFNEHPEIRKYIEIPSGDISDSDYCEIHRRVLYYYRKLIPKDKEYYLAPFSIKKGSNIYGLIFGTGHLRGIDKFIKQCWKIDPQTGDSNFDIDNDKIDPLQLSLLPDGNKPKKVQAFENELVDSILGKELTTNTDIFRYTLLNGFTPKHGRDVIQTLIREGKLPKQKLNISYGSCKADSCEQRIIY